jgi:hypothetical protein
MREPFDASDKNKMEWQSGLLKQHLGETPEKCGKGSGYSWMAENDTVSSSDGIFKLIQRWDRYIIAVGGNVEKSDDTSVE